MPIIINDINNTNIDGANGISIFAPYDTMKNFATTYLSVYNDFEYGSKYKSFMNRFYSMKDGGASSALTSAVVANSDFEVSGNEFQLQLTEEQAAEFAKAKYIVFRKMNEDYYMPVFVSSNATLNENGVISRTVAWGVLEGIENTDLYNADSEGDENYRYDSLRLRYIIAKIRPL